MDQKTEIEGLRTLVGLLWKRVDDLTVLAETLRELLQQKRVLSDAEIEAKLVEGRTIQAQSMLKVFQKALPAFEEHAWRQILEKVDPKGPKQ